MIGLVGAIERHRQMVVVTSRACVLLLSSGSRFRRHSASGHAVHAVASEASTCLRRTYRTCRRPTSSSGRGALMPTPVARTMMKRCFIFASAGMCFSMPVDDDRAGHPALADLKARLAVNVRMIPIESRLLVRAECERRSAGFDPASRARRARRRPVPSATTPSRGNADSCPTQGRRWPADRREVDLERLAGLQFDRRRDAVHPFVLETR